MTTDLQQAALDYLTAGLHILALTGKKPNPRVHGDHWSYDDAFHGAPESEAEEKAVATAFGASVGTTGIAICIPPGMLVADVDTERAAELLVALDGYPSEDTIAAQTKNGAHIWYVAPGEERNRWLGDGQQPDPGRTLLFKGYGGYVVAPPSAHFDANGAQDATYRWGTNPLVIDGTLMMPDLLPAKARERFKAEDQFAAAAPPKEKLSHFNMEPEEGVPWHQWKPVWTYATEGLEKAIENAADGNQNNVIHWAALTCRDEGVPYEVAMERLLAAAVRGNHPRNRARDTIRGAYKRAPRG